MSEPRILIVGAGVVGMTCADALSDRYSDVAIVARDFDNATTSRIATAMWHVYLLDPNDTDVLEWSSSSLATFLRLIETDPESGLHLIHGVELFRQGDGAEPAWSHIPPVFEMLDADEVQSYPGVRWGYRISTPAADMDVYLPWLRARLRRKGVSFTSRALGAVSEIFDECDIIINCTGLGSRELVGDDSLQPVRGQYLVFPNHREGRPDYVGDDENPHGMAYAIPRGGDILVGGTEEYGEEDVRFVLDPRDLVDRAAEFAPWLDGIDLESARKVAGLRPYRPAGIRLEIDRSAPVPVIHNYGHGGSGFSLSWGCASAVERLVASTLGTSDR